MPAPAAAFTSRFASCTVAVIDRCMRAVASGGVLAEVDPDFSGHEVALIARDALEVAEAGDVAEHDLKESDWLLSAVAEARFKRAHDLRGRADADGAKAAWDSGALALEEIAASSNRSPALFYEDIFFEAAQSLARRRDRLALVRQIECLAEELTQTTEHNVRMELRDPPPSGKMPMSCSRCLSFFGQSIVVLASACGGSRFRSRFFDRRRRRERTGRSAATTEASGSDVDAHTVPADPSDGGDSGTDGYACTSVCNPGWSG